MKKKLILLLVVLTSILFVSGCTKKEATNKLKVVTSMFPQYDFARAIGKDNIELEMLLQPGGEIHHFDPKPSDIKKIMEADIFIYNGGEADSWVEDILASIEGSDVKIIKYIDLVTTMNEELVEGMEEAHDDHDHDRDHEDEDHDHETVVDEHVWTSPLNAITIIEKVTEEFIKLDDNNKDKYTVNSQNYIDEIKQVDKDIRRVVNNAKTKTLIFGDRFPFAYFAKTYGLTYYGAFPGCSTKSEAAPKTLTFLINKVKEEDSKAILTIELSNEQIAKTIASETNKPIMKLHSAHNVTATEFDNGVTYVSLMKQNVETLKVVLN